MFEMSQSLPYQYLDTGVILKVDFMNRQPLTTVNQPPETVPPTVVEENSAHTIFVDVKTSVLLETARAVGQMIHHIQLM